MTQQPNPEQAQRFRTVKAAIPSNRSANHAFLDYLINAEENGVPADFTAQIGHLEGIVQKLVWAHIETTAIALGL